MGELMRSFFLKSVFVSVLCSVRMVQESVVLDHRHFLHVLQNFARVLFSTLLFGHDYPC